MTITEIVNEFNTRYPDGTLEDPSPEIVADGFGIYEYRYRIHNGEVSKHGFFKIESPDGVEAFWLGSKPSIFKDQPRSFHFTETEAINKLKGLPSINEVLKIEMKLDGDRDIVTALVDLGSNSQYRSYVVWDDGSEKQARQIDNAS